MSSHDDLDVSYPVIRELPKDQILRRYRIRRRYSARRSLTRIEHHLRAWLLVSIGSNVLLLAALIEVWGRCYGGF